MRCCAPQSLPTHTTDRVAKGLNVVVDIAVVEIDEPGNVSKVDIGRTGPVMGRNCRRKAARIDTRIKISIVWQSFQFLRCGQPPVRASGISGTAVPRVQRGTSIQGIYPCWLYAVSSIIVAAPSRILAVAAALSLSTGFPHQASDIVRSGVIACIGNMSCGAGKTASSGRICKVRVLKRPGTVRA